MPPSHPLMQGQTLTERAMLAKVQELRAELAKARIDAATVIARASERKPSGLGRSMDTLCSCVSLHACQWLGTCVMAFVI